MQHCEDAAVLVYSLSALSDEAAHLTLLLDRFKTENVQWQTVVIHGQIHSAHQHTRMAQYSAPPNPVAAQLQVRQTLFGAFEEPPAELIRQIPEGYLLHG